MENVKTSTERIDRKTGVPSYKDKSLVSTVGQNNQESRQQYWATRSSVRLFARTAHSFACSALLASLARSTALTRSLTHSLALGTVNAMIGWVFFLCFSLFWPIVGRYVYRQMKRIGGRRCIAIGKSCLKAKISKSLSPKTAGRPK